MTVYLIRRVLLAIPTLIGVCLITFSLFFLIVKPNDLARRSIGSKNPTPQQIQAWKVQHGYDKPAGVQFVGFMKDLLTFHFGNSDVNNEPIAEKVEHGMGPSLAWSVPAFIAGLLTTIPLALLLAYHRGTYLDRIGTTLCVLMMSVSYVLYVIVGQYYMGKELRLAPILGYASGLAAARFVVMPVVISTLAGLGGTVRFFRTVMLEEMQQDYVRTARAKGVSERGVLYRHILKNAMIPILTSVVVTIPGLFLGGLLMESYFGIPGLGSVLNDAIKSFDFAVIRVMVYIGAVVYIVGVVLTDITYTLVDPRVRLS